MAKLFGFRIHSLTRFRGKSPLCNNLPRDRIYGRTRTDFQLRLSRPAQMGWRRHYRRNSWRSNLGTGRLRNEQPGGAMVGRCHGPVFGTADIVHPTAL